MGSSKHTTRRWALLILLACVVALCTKCVVIGWHSGYRHLWIEDKSILFLNDTTQTIADYARQEKDSVRVFAINARQLREAMQHHEWNYVYYYHTIENGKSYLTTYPSDLIVPRLPDSITPWPILPIFDYRNIHELNTRRYYGINFKYYKKTTQKAYRRLFEKDLLRGQELKGGVALFHRDSLVRITRDERELDFIADILRKTHHIK